MPRSAAVLARLAAPAASNTPDANLLRAFVASQQEDAFAELVRRHGPMVLGVCRRVLGDAHDAEDAFQATFLVLARKAGSVRSENVSAWLYGVAVRTARGVRLMRDRRRKHSLQSQEAGARSQNEPTPDSSLALHEQAAIIDEELAKLPDYFRDALVLCELRGLSRQQAAAELGVPEGTLSSRLASAKRKLAARLAARGLAGAGTLTAILAPAAVSAVLLESTSLAVRGAAGGVAGAAASTVLKGMLFEQLRASVFTAFVLVGAVCGGLAMTGAPGTPDAPPVKAGTANTSPPAEDPAALVKQLGSDDFATREAAEKQLKELGSKAEAALKAGLKSDAPEIRARCAKLLTDIRKDALDALIKDFNPAVEKQPDHPVWRRFKAVAGDTRASRALFASFVERSRFAAIDAGNNWLARLDAAETSPEAAARQYREAASAFARRARENMKLWFHIPVWPCDMADEAAFLLFLGTYPGTRDLPAALTEDEKELFREGEAQLCYARGVQLGLRGEMLETSGKFDPPVVKGPAGTRLAFAKLFTAWLERRDPTSSVMPQSLWLAAKNGVKEALPLARTIAADKFQHGRLPSPTLYAGALAVVAQFGTAADLPLFERHFKNAMDIASQESSVPPGAKAPPTIIAELRDAALGLALLLCDQDPFAFGFTKAEVRFRRVNGRPVLANYDAIHFGFSDDKTRTAAHAKAKAFLDKQKLVPKKEEPKPDPVAAKLVEQLGSEDFATREAAEKQLKELGSKARAALEGGLKSDDPEIRARCAKILTNIRKDTLDALVKNFNPVAENQPDHPVWRRFKEIVGNDLPARKLFAEIIADPRRLKLLDDADRDPDKVGDLYAAEVMNLHRGRIPRNGRPWCDAVVIYLGTYPATVGRLQDSARGEKTGEREMMTEYLYCVSMISTVENLGPNDLVSEKTIDLARALKPMAPALKRLLAAWYPFRDADLVSSGLGIAVSQEIEELLPFARRVAVDPKRPARMRYDALVLIVKFGTPKDLPLFEGLFADETVLFDGDLVKRGYPPSGEPGQTQSRDGAVGMALLLHDADPFEFGFRAAENKFERENGRPVVTRYDTVHFRFSNDKTRAAAHAKAKAFLDKQKEAPKELPKPDPTELVKQLGSDDFAEREAAEKALKELGAPAKPALLAGLKSDNPEIVKRCRELLEHLARAEFDAKHWPRFAKVIGEDKAARALFDRIRSQRRNVELLDAVAADPKAAGKLYDTRWNELNKAARIPTGVGQYQLKYAPLADVVGWMYLGTFPGAEGGFQTSYSLDFLPFMPISKNAPDALSTALRDETVSPALYRLVGKWTAARVDYSGRGYGFTLALLFDIKEVLPAARETCTAKVKDDPYPGNTARNVGYAMLVLGKLGSKDDLPLLEKFATNEDHCATVLNDPPEKPGEPVFRIYRLPKDGQDATGQLRDVSAAMRLHLLGENPIDFGFYWQNPHDKEKKPVKAEAKFNLYSIGFLRKTDRTAAHKKAQEWFDKQKK